MKESADQYIQPRSAPLSHLSEEQPRASFFASIDWRNLAVGAIVIAVIIIALSWRPAVEVAIPASSGPGSEKTSTGAQPSKQDPALAPFAATQRERARAKAQDALAAFVERQIELEDSMQVETWGADELRAAMALAQKGDAYFLAEEFDASIEAYKQAANELASILQLGHERIAERLKAAEAAVNERDVGLAQSHLRDALIIKPDDPTVQALAHRIEILPQVITALRDAKNHELGGRFDAALEVYQQIAEMDPATEGLSALRQQAQAGLAANDLNAFISEGFSALDTGRFNAARTAFRKALQLDPNNAIAKGGLQQVDKSNDLALIASARNTAEQAMREENWSGAIDAYQRVIDIDSNIRFAIDGKAQAEAHQKSRDLLTRIASEPQKLASEKLYLEAGTILERARSLQYAGPELNKLTDQVAGLLVQYRDPVDVVLVSDNATEIILSNVGRLGAFDRKTVSLRPGQYTIRGSQRGCKDIYLTVDVLPGIEPLDLSCPERISR